MECKTLTDYQQQINIRHDFAIKIPGKFSKDKVDALCNDLKTFGFRTATHEQKDDKEKEIAEFNIFIAFDNEQRILQEAVRQKIRIQESSYTEE